MKDLRLIESCADDLEEFFIRLPSVLSGLRIEYCKWDKNGCHFFQAERSEDGFNVLIREGEKPDEN